LGSGTARPISENAPLNVGTGAVPSMMSVPTRSQLGSRTALRIQGWRSGMPAGKGGPGAAIRGEPESQKKFWSAPARATWGTKKSCSLSPRENGVEKLTVNVTWVPVWAPSPPVLNGAAVGTLRTDRTVVTEPPVAVVKLRVLVALSRLSNATSEGELSRVGTLPSNGPESAGKMR